MAQPSPDINPATGKQWDLNSLMERVIELQEQLLQSQEKNLLLSAQTRELERVARDADDLKAELAAQGVLLADKTKENKNLHQEMSRVTSVLDVKLNAVEELQAMVVDLQGQLKMRESERDLLAVMLNEAENAQRRAEESSAAMAKDVSGNSGLWPFKGKK